MDILGPMEMELGLVILALRLETRKQLDWLCPNIPAFLKPTLANKLSRGLRKSLHPAAGHEEIVTACTPCKNCVQIVVEDATQ